MTTACRLPFFLCLCLCLAACSTVETPTSAGASPGGTAAPTAKPSEPAQGDPKAGPDRQGEQEKQQKAEQEKKAEQERKADERAAKAKELRQKRRELDYARIEQQAGDLDRQVRLLAVEAAAQKARHEAEKAQKDLDLFLAVQRQKELDEAKLGVDRSTWHAEHQKDELAELEGMYKEEEFAKATKELVLKRGRRSMELAERELQLQKTGSELLGKHTLPDRERALRQRVADTTFEQQKAEFEAQKARIEIELGKRKIADRIEELELEIKDLQARVERDQQS